MDKQNEARPAFPSPTNPGDVEGRDRGSLRLVPISTNSPDKVFHAPSSGNAILERPPVSPITPTDESTPPHWPRYAETQQRSSSCDGHPQNPAGETATSHAVAQHRQARTALPNSSQTLQSQEQLAATRTSQQSVPSAAGHEGPSSSPDARSTETNFVSRPSSEAIDETSNADIAALKACISVLQLQKEKSRRDILDLQQIKDAAIADPTGFVTNLQRQDVEERTTTSNPLAPSFQNPDRSTDDEAGSEPANDAADERIGSKFGTIPRPQNIVRCPPINWSKYHVIGESLDRMHEDQRQRPEPGAPWQDPARESVAFAPFSPFKDNPLQQHISTPAKRIGKRPPTYEKPAQSSSSRKREQEAGPYGHGGASDVGV